MNGYVNNFDQWGSHGPAVSKIEILQKCVEIMRLKNQTSLDIRVSDLEKSIKSKPKAKKETKKQEDEDN